MNIAMGATAMTMKNQGFEEQSPAPLSGQPLPAPAAQEPSLGAIASAVVAACVTEKDWMYFDRSLNDIRMSRSDQIHKEPLFGDWYDDFEDPAEPLKR
jgi:hypothetical protein